MPLAIELAAARVDALGVTQLLDRMDDGSRCWLTATGWPSSASGRWPRRCGGAMSCWMTTSKGRSALYRLFPAPSP
jgi:hypothetical protein